MDKNIYGQGHGHIVPDQALAHKLSMEVYDRNLDRNLTPNIALADADFEGDLVCGKVVTFLSKETIDPTLWQEVQGNEEPETSYIDLCTKEVKICGSKDLNIKLSVGQLRKLACEGLESVYYDHVEKTISDTLDEMWDESHLAHMIMMADEINTGNDALEGVVNLGSPAQPIVIPNNPSAGADALERVISDLQLALTSHNAMSFSGDTALVLPTIAANRALPIFRDLNQCCGENNIRVKGQLSNTIYGFDAFQTNRKVMTTVHNGRRIYYIIAADKYASGFVSELYNFKWWEGKRDWFLVGTEVHGSYVVQPKHVAIAVVTFDN